MTTLDRRTILSAGPIGLAALAGGTAAQAQGDGGAASAPPLAGKAAFVTGAARGIGRGIAVQLARAGADVALLDIARPDAVPWMSYPLATPADLAETERLVRAEGRRALAVTGDVRDLPALTRAMARAREAFGRLDIVVANAGINTAGDDLESYTPERMETMLAVNVTGVANSIKAAAPVLTAPGGRIIVVTSQVGRTGSADFTYSPSKWAATGVMKSASLTLGERGIAVNAVAPGPVDTAMAYREQGGRDTAENRAAAEERARESSVLPVGQIQPDEIGDTVVFLAGPMAERISGVTIEVNGGRTARSLG